MRPDLVGAVLLFRSRASLAAEILVLRHQINILRRHSPKRQTFRAMDRLILPGYIDWRQQSYTLWRF